MSSKYKHWKKLFLCCLGLFAGVAFCMKWVERDFIQNGDTFTIIGLEISYSKDKVQAILSGLDASVRDILRYQLVFDFVFMAGVYPGIAALCMMAREKRSAGWLKKTLFVLAALQMVAWGCDIAENLYLLKWISTPVIGNEFGLYHFIVWAKWIIAIAGALTGITLVPGPKRTISTA